MGKAKKIEVVKGVEPDKELAPLNTMGKTVFGGKLTLLPIGLVIKEGIPYKDWETIGKIIRLVRGPTHWWLGDWLKHGERKWGEKYTQAIEETSFDYNTLRSDFYIAERIELARRRANLTHRHHQEVLYLDPEAQDDKQTLMDASWVCGKVETSSRDEVLSFHHHRAVAPFAREEKDEEGRRKQKEWEEGQKEIKKWLEEAVKNKWLEAIEFYTKFFLDEDGKPKYKELSTGVDNLSHLCYRDVAEQFSDLSRRRDKLSYEHHKEVAGRSYEELFEDAVTRDDILSRCRDKFNRYANALAYLLLIRFDFGRRRPLCTTVHGTGYMRKRYANVLANL